MNDKDQKPGLSAHPLNATMAEVRGFLVAAQEERDRWRERYGEAADALHQAATLLGWVVENQEQAFDDSREATRGEWPLGDNRAALLREWDRKMDEAKELSATINTRRALLPAKQAEGAQPQEGK